jgi:hypothetical protein
MQCHSYAIDCIAIVVVPRTSFHRDYPNPTSVFAQNSQNETARRACDAEAENALNSADGIPDCSRHTA